MENLPCIVKKRVDFFGDSCYNYFSLCKIGKGRFILLERNTFWV